MQRVVALSKKGQPGAHYNTSLRLGLKCLTEKNGVHSINDKLKKAHFNTDTPAYFRREEMII